MREHPPHIQRLIDRLEESAADEPSYDPRQAAAHAIEAARSDLREAHRQIAEAVRAGDMVRRAQHAEIAHRAETTAEAWEAVLEHFHAVAPRP